jgi:hypothetical protein
VYLDAFGDIGKELEAVLSEHNGFFGFDAAWLVRPLVQESPPLGILQWNQPALWKEAFESPRVADACFFAEDVFGCQFCLSNQSVYSFNPETAEFERLASSVKNWMARILADPEGLTGWPVARDWARTKGDLERGFRLVPKVPFVLGGSYELSNLYPSRDVDAMRFRGTLASQLRGVEDGANVILRRRPDT